MKSMAKMEYHYGLKVRIYPSDKQKQIIKLNSDASRFIYNEMVAINKELWQLKQVTLFSHELSNWNFAKMLNKCRIISSS